MSQIHTNPNNILRQIQRALEAGDAELARVEAMDLKKCIMRGDEPDWARAYPSTVRFFFVEGFGRKMS